MIKNILIMLRFFEKKTDGGRKSQISFFFEIRLGDSTQKYQNIKISNA